jgi:hypothetical protein
LKDLFDKKNNFFFYLIIVCLAALKVLFILFYHIHFSVFENHSIAINFAGSGTLYYAHDGNIDYDHQFPLYDFCLGVVYLIFGISLKAAAIMQVCANLISCALLFNISSSMMEQMNIKIAWLPFMMGIICCLHPFLLYYQIFLIHPLTFDVLMPMLLMWISFKYFGKPSSLILVLVIVIAGLTSIERFTLIVAVIPFLIILQKQKNKKIFSAYLLSVAAGIIIFSGSWMVRNYFHNGQLQLTSGTYRYLWIGSLAETSGTNYVDSHLNYYDLLQKDGISLAGKTIVEQSENYKKVYLSKWKTDPVLMIKMFFVRCKTFWWFPPKAGSQHQDVSGNSIIVYQLLHSLMLMLAMTGILKCKRKSFPWLSFPVALCVLQGIFYMEVRHRMPSEPIIWFFALVGISVLMTRLRGSFRIFNFAE